MIYICSRLSAPTNAEIKQNMLRARGYCETVAKRTGKRTFAPHSFLPEYVDDNIPAERAAALKFGKEMLALAEEVWVFTDGEENISKGMEGEIALAKKLHIPIKFILDIEEL